MPEGAVNTTIFFRYSGKALFGIDSQHRELAFVITGGQGKFLGASGSGVFQDSVDFNMQKTIRSIEGSIVLGPAQGG